MVVKVLDIYMDVLPRHHGCGLARTARACGMVLTFHLFTNYGLRQFSGTC